MISNDALRAQPYRLPFRRPLRTSRQTLDERHGWWISIHDADGRVGWGEAAPWPGFGAGEAAIAAALDGARDPATVPELLWAAATARLDLVGQRRAVSMAHCLADAPRTSVPVHALVADAVEAIDAVRRGFRGLKLKVGAASIRDDAARLAAVRDAVGPAVALHADANGAWSFAEAVVAVSAFAPVRLAWLEQPVTSMATLASLRRHVRGSVAIAADEAICDPAALDALITANAIDIAVLKPAFLGAPSTTIAMAQRAVEAGIDVVVTGALESAVGRTAALHVACALAAPPRSCGLEAPLARDVARWPDPVDGARAAPSRPGLGATP